ncbi:hypothetical protein [Flavisolibacter nicotianae]|uniref:hypothetical protein n=1 Tax=Flavisolibacter nicotianae TaxID=2364882 RepID=UPI0013C460DB|nr:hypothetical protein [Flavisolibacter nicotianae]
MTLHQFRSLSEDVQRRIIQQNGVFLLGRTGVGITAKLYQLNGFYVEMFWDEKMAEVVHLVSFDDPAKLENYFHLVLVSELQALLRL